MQQQPWRQVAVVAVGVAKLDCRITNTEGGTSRAADVLCCHLRSLLSPATLPGALAGFGGQRLARRRAHPQAARAAAGAPAVKDLDAPGPQGIEGAEKVGAGIMFL